MAMAIATVAPYVPVDPQCGGVVGSLAICANGQSTGSVGVSAGRFSVLDPVAGTQQAYQMTGAGGHTLCYGRFAGVHGGGVVAAYHTAVTASQLQMVRMYTNGTYDIYPTVISMVVPDLVVVGNDWWLFTGGSGGAPINVYDTTTNLFRTGTGLVNVGGGYGQSVYVNGSVYHWANSTTFYKYNPTTFARTTVTVPAFSPRSNSQVVVIGTKAYWIATTNTTMICLNASTDTFTTHALGASFSAGSLTLGTDGKLYGGLGSTLTAIQSWDPTTGATTSDSTGVSGLSNHNIALTAGGKLCFPANS